jgi:hypothetical protein
MYISLKLFNAECDIFGCCSATGVYIPQMIIFKEEMILESHRRWVKSADDRDQLHY